MGRTVRKRRLLKNKHEHMSLPIKRTDDNNEAGGGKGGRLAAGQQPQQPPPPQPPPPQLQDIDDTIG